MKFYLPYSTLYKKKKPRYSQRHAGWRNKGQWPWKGYIVHSGDYIFGDTEAFTNILKQINL